MKLLVLSGPDVHELLSYGECVQAMRSGLSELASGTAQQPVRVIISSWSAAGMMGLMPSFREGGAGAYGLKAICITPGNPAAGLDSHQGVVLLSDGATGVPLAVLNASAVTEIRTAAVSVLATDLLARPGAADLAIIGTGVQARAHVLALGQSRPLRRVRVAGRDTAKAAAFAESLRPALEAEITGCASAAEAVAGADIIVTATTSAKPVLHRDWVAAGAHVNAVGACLPDARELDGALVAGAALYADSLEGLRAEAGDFLLAEAEGLIGRDDVRGTLGELLAGTAAGRRDDEEITVFESLGLAVEDLAAAQAAYDLAQQAGAGQWFDF
ncbi:MAG TPA: ornithine cyclodeaminase family protein [Streptosporangiaceae bacterium]|jgi:ornithine cyclodeaminase